MNLRYTLVLCASVLSALVCSLEQLAAYEASAQEPPASAEVMELLVYPSAVNLVGADNSCQLIVTGLLASGSDQDLTGDVRFEVVDARIVAVSPTGRVVPLASGATTITVRYRASSIAVPVVTRSIEQVQPINFANHIVPIFTKARLQRGRVSRQIGWAERVFPIVARLHSGT